MTIRLIGLCGYAQVGKDTAAKNMPGWNRAAFADALKRDLRPFILSHYNLDVYTTYGPDKELIRPLLVAHGACQRKRDPDYWINRLEPVEPTVITDVRYLNEARWVLDQGGVVVWIIRPGYKPMNEEEHVSISAVCRVLEPPSVLNDSTPEVLGMRVLRAACET